MRLSLYDPQQRLRSGWKMIAFMAAAAALCIIAGLSRKWLPPDIKQYVPNVLLLIGGMLLTSAIAVRLERKALVVFGLKLNARFAAHLTIGIAGGAGLILVAAAIVWLLDGFHLVQSPRGTVVGIAIGAAMMLGVAIFEELIFRGYAFQRAIQGMGIWRAQLLFAVLFCAAHPLDDGMSIADTVLAILNLFLVAILLGYCYLQTQSLALPIGVHMGWNWAQKSLGFGVSGIASQGWWVPVFHQQPTWLTGGKFGLEASIIGAVVLAIGIGTLARWKPPSSAIAG